jgi:hypothetical protein
MERRCWLPIDDLDHDSAAIFIFLAAAGAGGSPPCGLPESFDPRPTAGRAFAWQGSFGKQLVALIAHESSGHGLRFQLTLPAAAGFDRRTHVALFWH